MLSKHGCTVPWMPNPIICTSENLNGTMQDVLGTYRMIIKSGKILDLCQQPCKTMKFVFGWPDVANDEGCKKLVTHSVILSMTTIFYRRGRLAMSACTLVSGLWSRGVFWTTHGFQQWLNLVAT